MIRINLALFLISIFIPACAAPTASSPAPSQQTSEVSETSDVSTSPPTETLAPTATPEPTATPTPEPTVIQKEISFNVTRANGEAITISMPAFIPNIPEGATPEQIADIEKQVLAEAFEFIVNDNVDWGNVKALPYSAYTNEEVKYFRDFGLIPNFGKIYGGHAVVTIEPVGNSVPDGNNTIGVMVNSLTHDETDGTILRYVTGDGEVIGNSVFIGIHVNTVVPLIKFQTITLDLDN